MRRPKTRSQPSLDKFGVAKGYGWPAELFLTAAQDEIDLDGSWEQHRYAINDLRGRLDRLPSAASAKPAIAASRRSRGKGIEFAVEIGVLMLYLRSTEHLVEIDPPLPGRVPRFKAQNITRKEIAPKIKWECAALNGYSLESIKAEVSRLVKFPPGRATHH